MNVSWAYYVFVYVYWCLPVYSVYYSVCALLTIGALHRPVTCTDPWHLVTILSNARMLILYYIIMG